MSCQLPGWTVLCNEQNSGGFDVIVAGESSLEGHPESPNFEKYASNGGAPKNKDGLHTACLAVCEHEGREKWLRKESNQLQPNPFGGGMALMPMCFLFP